MTVEAHTVMLQMQFYKCAACGDKFETEPINNMKGACVDHDHKTNAIRELICRQCNILIGNASDDIGRLEKAIAYLRKHGK